MADVGPRRKAGGAGGRDKKKKDNQCLKDFVESRDWVGAITFLEFARKSGEDLKESPEWLPYCAFHSGDYRRASKYYQELIDSSVPPPDPSTQQSTNSTPPAEQSKKYLHTCLACCYYFMGMYKEAEAEVAKDDSGATCGAGMESLRHRLLFHLAHKFNDEQKLMEYHQKLGQGIEDQLCLASIHTLRSHYQEAIDVYKRFLLDRKDYLALNVYVALCYYKLDYFDVSHEVLNVYLSSFQDSPVATNLKACNHYKSYNGKAGETELKRLTDLMAAANAAAGGSASDLLGGGGSGSGAGGAGPNGQPAGRTLAADLVKHNLVVFRNGEGALQVLPPLLGVVPESQLNLVVYYLKNDDVDEAFQLIKDLEPSTSQEYLLKGVVNAAYGQKHDSREYVKLAQQYFQLVGSSPTDCDTIPGRQCMASCFFLLKQFDDVLVYLNSIKNYFTNDDDFNFDYGIAKAHQGDYRGAEEAFLLVHNDQYKADYCYISWLARCYIMNGKAYQAWELYLKMDSSPDSYNLLQLIANDCYKMGAFYYSAKAFDVLDRLDGSPEFWVGKRGACVGVFQQVIANEETKEHLRDTVNLLKASHNPQVESILKVIRKWAKENNVKL